MEVLVWVSRFLPMCFVVFFVVCVGLTYSQEGGSENDKWTKHYQMPEVENKPEQDNFL